MVGVGAWNDDEDALFDELTKKLAKGATIRDFAKVNKGDVGGKDEKANIWVEEFREEVREEPAVIAKARGPTSSTAPAPKSLIPEME